VHVNFNLPPSFILLIIEHNSVLYIAFGTFYLFFFHIFSTNNYTLLRNFIHQCEGRDLFQ